MHFKKIYIKDFGIFRHQKIDNLNDNINIIGGLNRSGKTTFLKMLRYLAYGFPRKDNFIPANNKYNVEAVLKYKKQKYNLLTKGYSDPILSRLDDKVNKIDAKKNNEINIEDIFNIDNFSYKQLYTISLDQLKRIPDSASQKTEKLQSILLGAGFGELLELQDLKENFINKAEKIGGKNGSVNVMEFKEYYKEIKRGIKLRDNANSELADFNNLKENFKNKNNEIEKLEDKITKLNLKLDRLDLLKNNYQKMKNIDQLLQNNNYIMNINLNNFDFSSLYKQLTTLTEKYKNNKEEKQNNSFKKQKLLKKLKKINNDWDDEDYLNYILKLNFDFVEDKKLNNYIYEFKSLRKDIEKLQEEKSVKKNRLKKLKNKMKDLNDRINRTYNKKYIIFSLLSILLGMIMILINWPTAVIISFFGISASYFYSKEKREKANFYEKEKLNLKDDLNEIELKLDKLDKKLQNKINKKEKISDFLDKIYEKLDLNPAIKVDILKDYFKEVNDLQEKIREWKLERNRIKNNENMLEKEFAKINKKLFKLNIINNKNLEIDSDINFVNEKLEKLMEWKKTKFSILSTLNTDRAKNAFHENEAETKKDKLWNDFFDLYKEYLSQTDVKNNYKEVKRKLKNSKRILEKEKNKRQDIKNEINRLESSDKLKRARKIIFKNRKKLKNKAKNYGKNLTAAFILEKTYDKILNEMEEEIFNLTSKYFKEITGQEYIKVLPTNNLENIDFKTVLNNGNKYNTTEILSRGTKEQLFLAVRLSRIEAMGDKLPVLFDDSLVNFDAYHLKNTLNLIKNISENNQIFIFTCHSHLIDKLNFNNDNISYWKLKNGEFKITSKNKLKKFLEISSN